MLGKLIGVGEIQHVFAVKVRQAVTRTQIQRIISVVKEANRALLVGRMREGIGSAYLQAMTHALFNMGLERVVSRDTGGGVGLRFGGIADIGDAQVDIPAFKCLQVRLPVGQRLGSESGGIEYRVSVCKVLLVRASLQEGMGRRGNLRLIERQGNDLMAAQIADVSNVDREVFAGLPLNVQCLIHRVGELAGAVVISEREQRYPG